MKKSESEYAKLENMLEIYSKILHPDFLGVFKRQLYAVYEENKKQAYEEAKISDNAILLDKKLIELQDKIKREPSVSSFYIKCIYKEILKIYFP